MVYSFQEASQIARHMARPYGQWQNSECRQMAAELKLGLDGFWPCASYSQPKSADYVSTEFTGYLRQIGALEEAGGM